jgi:hypothetical protein
MQEKTYLGDGVYAQEDSCGIVLTTENGIEATNIIHLDIYVIKSMIAFLRKYNDSLVQNTLITNSQ